MTSTCLRRSGFAQAGQITNKFPCLPIGREFVIWNFGHDALCDTG
jgi:hypothetical protein